MPVFASRLYLMVGEMDFGVYFNNVGGNLVAEVPNVGQQKGLNLMIDNGMAGGYMTISVPADVTPEFEGRIRVYQDNETFYTRTFNTSWYGATFDIPASAIRKVELFGTNLQGSALIITPTSIPTIDTRYAYRFYYNSSNAVCEPWDYPYDTTQFIIYKNGRAWLYINLTNA